MKKWCHLLEVLYWVFPVPIKCQHCQRPTHFISWPWLTPDSPLTSLLGLSFRMKDACDCLPCSPWFPEGRRMKPEGNGNKWIEATEVSKRVPVDTLQAQGAGKVTFSFSAQRMRKSSKIISLKNCTFSFYIFLQTMQPSFSSVVSILCELLLTMVSSSCKVFSFIFICWGYFWRVFFFFCF